MVKKRERNEVEYLRGLVRELKAENRNLKKRLGVTSKRARRYETRISEDEDEQLERSEQPVKVVDSCPDCSGELKLVDLGVRQFNSCINCGYRSPAVKKR